MQTKNCEECGHSFEVKWPKNPNRFCSYSCRSKFNAATLPSMQIGERIEVACGQCGKAMSLVPSAVGDRKFCSKECDSAARRLVKGESHPLYKEKVVMSCKVCGKVCKVKPSLESRFVACSRHCASVWGHKLKPRISSLEVAFSEELKRQGEEFRAQEILGRHIVDFYLPNRNLAIECDGAYWHSGPKVKARDAIKTSELRSLGITVVRISEQVIREDVSAAVSHATNPHLRRLQE